VRLIKKASLRLRLRAGDVASRIAMGFRVRAAHWVTRLFCAQTNSVWTQKSLATSLAPMGSTIGAFLAFGSGTHLAKVVARVFAAKRCLFSVKYNLVFEL
jgi:hypothetical protein